MADLKTCPTRQSVEAFLRSVPDEGRRRDSRTPVQIMRQSTKCEPQMWGTSIVGFGKFHYVYASGREGDWFLIGFSPRKQNLTLYLTTGFEGAGELLRALGKHKRTGSCLYLRSLDDVHLPTLKRLLRAAVRRKPRWAG
jgi:Domain of unknown function (DU1801)